MYIVELDRENSVIVSIISGFLVPAEVTKYINSVEHMMIRNRLHRGYRLIVDVSDCVIQTQETIVALGQHMAAMPKANRIAIVVGSSIASGQVRRLFTQKYASFVSNRQAGIDWIMSKNVD